MKLQFFQQTSYKLSFQRIKWIDSKSVYEYLVEKTQAAEACLSKAKVDK